MDENLGPRRSSARLGLEGGARIAVRALVVTRTKFIDAVNIFSSSVNFG